MTQASNSARPQSASQAAANAHTRGLHAAQPDVHCPTCQEYGYVGAGFDRERVATGSLG